MNSDVPQNMHTWTQNIMIEVMSGLTCQLAGVDPVNPNQKCLGVDQKSGKIGFVEGGGGAIGMMGSLIAMTYTPPLHTGDYFQDLAKNFGLAKPAYAQGAGVGFQGLQPLMGLWSAFRNIVYLLFVIVFVVIGLAIMLRVKIDPRTVMTLENQIPKIIIGLILVTFSFAIAGFLIDLMWVMIYLIFNVISGVSPGIAKDLNPVAMQGQSTIQAIGGIAPGGIGGIAGNIATPMQNIIRDILGVSACNEGLTGPCANSLFNPFQPFVNMVLGTAEDNGPVNWIFGTISTFVGAQVFWNVAHIPATGGGILGDILGPVKDIIKGTTAGVMGYATFVAMQGTLRVILPYLIVWLIVFIAILWAMFRLWFQLIIAYVFILIDVVFAPFWIVAGLFPGSPVSFGAWLRDIIANLSVFPVTIGMFLLGKVFIDNFKAAPKNMFVPPLIGNYLEPELLGALIGLGIILLTPQVVNTMKEALKAPQFKQGAAIGQAIGVGPAVTGGLFTAIASPYGALAMFRNIPQNLLGKRSDRAAQAAKDILTPRATEGTQQKPANP
ncbi:MAG: hypothetical protein ABH816_01250 [Candidatus Levyibacteriota bacterium]